MTCFVQIFIFTTVYSKIKKNKNISLSTLKLKNKSETDFFLCLNDMRAFEHTAFGQMCNSVACTSKYEPFKYNDYMVC